MARRLLGFRQKRHKLADQPRFASFEKLKIWQRRGAAQRCYSNGNFRMGGNSPAVLIGESVDGSHRAASCFSMNFAASAAEMVRWAKAAEQTLPSLWLRLMRLEPLPRPFLFQG